MPAINISPLHRRNCNATPNVSTREGSKLTNYVIKKLQRGNERLGIMYFH